MTIYNYFNNIQPTIVKCSSTSESIPEELRGQYMISLVMPITIDTATQDNYILVLDESTGMLVPLLTNDSETITVTSENYDTESYGLDVPRVYIKITEDLVTDQALFMNWYLRAIYNIGHLVNGYSTFLVGESYYFNERLYDYLNETVASDLPEDSYLPDLLDSNLLYTEAWVDIGAAAISRDIEYFYNKNAIASGSSEFTEDDLDNLPQTIFSLILEYGGTIDDNLKIALQFYANGGYDDVSVALTNILGSTVTTSVTTIVGCGCNSNQLGDSSSSSSCAEIYEGALKQILIDAFSSVSFYSSVFYTIDSNDECVVNDVLIDSIESLLQSLLDASGILISSSSLSSGCGLSSYDTLVSEDANNRLIIKRYIEALEYIRNDELSTRKNFILSASKKFINMLFDFIEN